MSQYDTAPETEAIVRAYYDSSLAADAEGLAAVFDPEVEVHEPSSLPYGGVWRGIDEVVGLHQTLWAAIDLRTVEIVDVVAKGERAASFLRVPFALGDPAEPAVMAIVETFVLRAGKIVEMRPFYFDTAAMVGAAPAAASAGSPASGMAATPATGR